MIRITRFEGHVTNDCHKIDCCLTVPLRPGQAQHLNDCQIVKEREDRHAPKPQSAVDELEAPLRREIQQQDRLSTETESLLIKA